MSQRSLWAMRRAIYDLPLQALSRPVLITLTYPGGTWRDYVANDQVWGAHRDRLFKRWERRWGEPVKGVWVKEFQRRGAPHLHVVASLPAAVSDEDYGGLQARSKRLFGVHNTFGKPAAGEVWRAVEGEFGRWLRTQWSEVVTGNVLTDRASRRHHARGVTLRVRFDHGEGELENRVRMIGYLLGEFGKTDQKQAPGDFGGVRQWWGYRGPGFKPEWSEFVLSESVGWRVRRRLIRWVAVEVGRRSGWQVARSYRANLERYKQGVEARGLSEEDGLRVLRWSLAAERCAVEGRGGAAASGASSGRFLGAVDVSTGEVVTPSGALN